jgi:hypothetical protein
MRNGARREKSKIELSNLFAQKRQKTRKKEAKFEQEKRRELGLNIRLNLPLYFFDSARLTVLNDSINLTLCT